MHAVKYLH